jgi:hypothetical protein
MLTLFDFLQRWRFLLLLFALLALLVVQPIASAFGLMTTLFNALVVAVMIALVIALAADSRWRAIAGVFCIAVAAFIFGGRFLSAAGQVASEGAGQAIGAAFFVIVAGKIVYSIFRSPQLTFDSVFGAVCGYLLLGLAWALAYDMIYAARPESFAIAPVAVQHMHEPGGYRHLFVYYSFVTLTTVGYGDITPISAPARTLSWFEAMTGQLYLTVLIAGLISALVASRPMRVNLVGPEGEK